MLPLIIYRIKDKFLNIGQKWDQLAPDQAHAIEFAHTHINPEPLHTPIGTPPPPEFFLARKGDEINHYYRQDTPKEEYKKISAMMAKHSTDIDLVLYRGICPDVYKSMKRNARKKSNCNLFEKGYLSCSLVKGKEKRAIYHLRIFIPAGTHVTYLGNVNGEENVYYEVAVQHSSKLKVISKDNKYINCLLTETI